MEKIFIEFPGVKALKGVDFAMKSGSIHALIGANGAGKSTLMKVLSGAYDHYEGEILLGGKRLKSEIRSRLRCWVLISFSKKLIQRLYRI